MKRELVRVGDEVGERMALLGEVARGSGRARRAPSVEQEGGGDAEREADRERRERALGEVRAPLDGGDRRGPRSGRTPGPTTIAPMIRISWSVRIPTAAISIASAMKARKLAESSMFSEVRDSTSSQTTASEGRPVGRLLGAHGRDWRSASRCPRSRSSPRGRRRARAGRRRSRWRPRGRRRRGSRRPRGAARRARDRSGCRPRACCSSSSSACSAW